jgi:nicotinamidase-related amidase
MKTALLVIDVQQGLCEGEHDAFESRQLIERINRLSARARSAGAPVVFIQHETREAPFEHGSRTWQLADGLLTAPGDLFLRKTASDSFHRTDLQSLLQQHGVTDLVVCGLHTEFCVDSTVRRALALGYPVVLAADAHSTEDKAHLSASQIIRHHNATLADIGSFGPRVRAIASDELVFGA